MTDKYASIRIALDNVPHCKWTASGPTVSIPETEDWPGKNISITGMDKRVARRLARYLATMNPAAIHSLLADADRAVALEPLNDPSERALLLAAADYLDGDCMSIDGEQADRAAALLRRLAGGASLE